MREPHRSRAVACLAASASSLCLASGIAIAQGEVTGTFTANGEEVALPYVYVYEVDGFHDESDPAWEIVFASEEIAERDVDEFFMAFPYVKVKITRPGDPDLADDDHGLTVFSHNLMLSADGANLSGGTSPNLALDEVGPDRFSGRIWLDETQEFFDDTYHYDLRFAADLSDPNAPIGPPLPADGGEPGKAYTAWVAAVHSGELDRIRALMPADMQEMLEEEIEGRSDEEVAEMLEMLTLFTPADAKVVGGSSDGDTAILDVTGTMEGEAVKGEVTMNRVNGTWILVGEAWQ